MRVLGIDISKSSVSACLLTEKPPVPRQYYFDCQFYRFEANAVGIKEMLALEPDIAIMEPTGINYAKLWMSHLGHAGVEVRLVGHKELRDYRKVCLNLPDKDDNIDALALACYYFDYHDSPRRFACVRDLPSARIRELMLRLGHLNRIQSPIINRLRQDLAWQFPEVAAVRSERSASGEPPLLWAWIAGIRPSKRYDKLYEQTAGLGLNAAVKSHAARICDLQREEVAIELELQEILQSEKFIKYRNVFARFGFGFRTEALLLSQIYPLEKYFGPDGKPEVKISKGKKSGKPTKKYLSLRRFQKSLGVAPSLEQSGDKSKQQIAGGSSLCRKALWQWIFTKIEPARNRLKNEIGESLGKALDEDKSKLPAQLARTRTCARAAKLLFRELVKELTAATGPTVEVATELATE